MTDRLHSVILGVCCVVGACGDAGSAAGSGGQKVLPVADAAASRVDPQASAYLEFLRERASDSMAAQRDVVPGTGADLLFVPELRHLGAGPFWGKAAAGVGRAAREDRRDPLPAILDFHAQMMAKGIDWVFVPVPAKPAVTPTVVPGAPAVEARVDEHHLAFYAKLRAAGVPVLDLTPSMRELGAKGARSHCATDTHWSGAACVRAAELIKRQFGEPDWWQKRVASRYSTDAPSAVEIDGDLRKLLGDAPDGGDAIVDKESLMLTFVRDAETGEPPATDRASPILLLGDSHCLVFHAGGDLHARGAGLADHLAHRFGMPIDVLGVRGSGATASRVSLRRSKGRLENKKFVIWCLTVREFTEATSGWAKVPLD